MEKKYTISWELGPLNGTASYTAGSIEAALADFQSDAIKDTVVIGIRETIKRGSK